MVTLEEWDLENNPQERFNGNLLASYLQETLPIGLTINFVLIWTEAATCFLLGATLFFAYHKLKDLMFKQLINIW
jgi:hypothetical protein